MLNCANLRKTGTGWEFESEVALEDFVWTNLKQLLGLTPRKRQYRVNGQICDIVAVDENKRLVVLELKNVEDRGIVQQLTRYYDALPDEKPFHEEIDYEQPVILVAITPTFHKDNLTDRKYHSISFHFLQFKIIQDEDKLYLQLKDIDTQQVSQVEILHKEKNDNNEIPSPPRICRTLLSKCTDYEQEAILKIREKILRFDRRMQEIASAGIILYGRGKGKPCAELRFDKSRNSPVLFLWLPMVSSGWKKKNFIGRMRVWTDWQIVSDVGHVPKAFGRMINHAEWKSGTIRPLKQLLPRRKEIKEKYFVDQVSRERHVESSKAYFGRNPSYKSPLAMSLQYYMKLIGKTEDFTSLDMLVDMALEKWLEKL